MSTFLVEVTMCLFRHDNITEKQYFEQIKKDPKQIYMYLYYTGDPAFEGVKMEVEKDFKPFKVDGFPAIRMTVRYNFPKKISPKKLFEGVQEIFDHWHNSSDIGWDLKTFKLLK